MLLLSPSANSAQTGGFSEKALAEEMKEREIERKKLGIELSNFLVGGVLKVKRELKMYMIYDI